MRGEGKGLDIDSAAFFELPGENYLTGFGKERSFTVLLVSFPQPVIIKCSITSELLAPTMSLAFTELPGINDGLVLIVYGSRAMLLI